MENIKLVQTPVLDIAYEEQGPPDGDPVVLLHGFPDDASSWDAVASGLAGTGYRTLAPYLRGFGPTRFRRVETPRSGQLAALAQDVIDFADALALERTIVVGQDWGARAAQAVAILCPERVKRLVSLGGYQISWATAGPPSYPQLHALWYQHLLNTPFGPAVLEADRHGFCRYLWRVWSPTWGDAEATFAATAPSFDNPDFVDVVVSGYRPAPPEGEHAETEARLAAGPPIAVPTVVLQGADDGVDLAESASSADDRHFTGGYARRLLDGVGHFPHRERPAAVVGAILTGA